MSGREHRAEQENPGDLMDHRDGHRHAQEQGGDAESHLHDHEQHGGGQDRAVGGVQPPPRNQPQRRDDRGGRERQQPMVELRRDRILERVAQPQPGDVVPRGDEKREVLGTGKPAGRTIEA